MKLKKKNAYRKMEAWDHVAAEWIVVIMRNAEMRLLLATVKKMRKRGTMWIATRRKMRICHNAPDAVFSNLIKLKRMTALKLKAARSVDRGTCNNFLLH